MKRTIIQENDRVVACLTFTKGVTEEQVYTMLQKMAAADKLENGSTQIMTIENEEYPIAYQP